MKFCVQCGKKLEITCPRCSSINLPGFKFCGECGHNLGVSASPLPEELPFDEQLKKIKKYLPKGLSDKILSQRHRIEGEHKQVTVMFCDTDSLKRNKEKVPRLRMRIGIHSGPVVVGTLGNDLRVEFKAVGDTVNPASRKDRHCLVKKVFEQQNTVNFFKGVVFCRLFSISRVDVKERGCSRIRCCLSHSL
jgi:hypothetical protein